MGWRFTLASPPHPANDDRKPSPAPGPLPPTQTPTHLATSIHSTRLAKSSSSATPFGCVILRQVVDWRVDATLWLPSAEMRALVLSMAAPIWIWSVTALLYVCIHRPKAQCTSSPQGRKAGSGSMRGRGVG